MLLTIELNFNQHRIDHSVPLTSTNLILFLIGSCLFFVICSRTRTRAHRNLAFKHGW